MPAGQRRKMSRIFVLVVVLLCPLVNSVSNGPEPAFVQNSPQMLHPTQHGGGMKRSASQVFRPKVQENSGKEQVKMSASEPGEPTKEVTLEDSERRRNQEEYAKTGIAFLIGSMNAFFHRVIIAFSDAVGMAKPDTKRKFKRVVHAGHNVATTLSRGQSSAEVEEILARLKKMEDDKLSTAAPARSASIRSAYSLPSYPGAGRAPTKIKVVSRMEEDEVQRVLDQTRQMNEERMLTDDESIVARMRQKSTRSGDDALSSASKGPSPAAERVPPQAIRSADVTRVGEDASRMTSEGSPSREGSLASQQRAAPSDGSFQAQQQHQQKQKQPKPDAREKTGAAAVTASAAVLTAPRTAPTAPRVAENADVQGMRDAAERMLGSGGSGGGGPGSRPPGEQRRKTYNLMAPEWGGGSERRRREDERGVDGEEERAVESAEERSGGEVEGGEKHEGKRYVLGMAMEKVKAQVKGKIDHVLAPFSSSPPRDAPTPAPAASDRGAERRVLGGAGRERVASRATEEDVQSVLASVQGMMASKGPKVDAPATEPTRKEYVMMSGLDASYRPSPLPPAPTAAASPPSTSAPPASAASAPTVAPSPEAPPAPVTDAEKKVVGSVETPKGKIEFAWQNVLASVQSMMAAKGPKVEAPVKGPRKEYVMMSGLDASYRPRSSPPVPTASATSAAPAPVVSAAPAPSPAPASQAAPSSSPSEVRSVLADAEKKVVGSVETPKGKIEFAWQNVLASVQSMMAAKGPKVDAPVKGPRKEYVMMSGLDASYRPRSSPPASASAPSVVPLTSASSPSKTSVSAPQASAPALAPSSQAAPSGSVEKKVATKEMSVETSKGKIEFAWQNVLASVQGMMAAKGFRIDEPAVVQQRKEYVMMSGLDASYRPRSSPPASAASAPSLAPASQAAPSTSPSAARSVLFNAEKQAARESVDLSAAADAMSARKDSKIEYVLGTALASAKKKIEYVLFGGPRPKHTAPSFWSRTGVDTPPEPVEQQPTKTASDVSAASSSLSLKASSENVKSVSTDAQRMTVPSAGAPTQIGEIGGGSPQLGGGSSSNKKDYFMLAGLDATRRATMPGSLSINELSLPSGDSRVEIPASDKAFKCSMSSDEDVRRILAEAQRRFEDQPLFPTPEHLEAVRGKLATLQAGESEADASVLPSASSFGPASAQQQTQPVPAATAPPVSNLAPVQPTFARAPVAAPVARAGSMPASAPAAAAPMPAPVAAKPATMAASPVSTQSPPPVRSSNKDYVMMGGLDASRSGARSRGSKSYSMMGGLDATRRPSASAVGAPAPAVAVPPSAPVTQPVATQTVPQSPPVSVKPVLVAAAPVTLAASPVSAQSPPPVRSSSKDYFMMGGLDGSRSGVRKGSSKGYAMMGGLDATRRPSGSSVGASSVAPSAPSTQPMATQTATRSAPERVSSKLDESDVQRVLEESQQLISASSSPPAVRTSSKDYYMMGGLDASRSGSGVRSRSSKSYSMMGGLDATRRPSAPTVGASTVGSSVAAPAPAPAAAPAPPSTQPAATHMAMQEPVAVKPASMAASPVSAQSPPAVRSSNKEYIMMGGLDASRSGARSRSSKGYSMMGGLDATRRPSGSSVGASVAMPAAAPVVAPSPPSAQPAVPTTAPQSPPVSVKPETVAAAPVFTQSPPAVRSSSKDYFMMGGLDGSRSASGPRSRSSKESAMMGGLDATRRPTPMSAPAASSPMAASAQSVPTSPPVAAAPMPAPVAAQPVTMAASPVTVAASPVASQPSVRSSNKEYVMMGGLDASRSGARSRSSKGYSMMGGLDATRRPSASSVGASVAAPAAAPSPPSTQPAAAPPTMQSPSTAVKPVSVAPAPVSAQSPPPVRSSNKDYFMMGGLDASRSGSGVRSRSSKSYSMMGGLDATRRPSASSVGSSVAAPAAAPAAAPSPPSTQPVAAPPAMQQPVTVAAAPVSAQSPPAVRSSSKDYFMMGGLDGSRSASGPRSRSSKGYAMMGGLDATLRPSASHAAPASSHAPVASGDDMQRVGADAGRMSRVDSSRVLAESEIQKILDNARVIAQEAGAHISEVRDGVSSLSR